METLAAPLQANVEECQAPLSFGATIGIVIACCVLGLIWAIVNMISVNKIDVRKGIDG